VIGAHRDAAESWEPRWDASIDLELERQNGLNWCWTAVAKGIVEHFGGPKRKQCQYATTFLHQKRTCCRSAVPGLRCDRSHDVDSVLMHYGMFAAPPFHRPVSIQTLYRELERDRPVVALMRYPASVHALVITAVDVTNGVLRYSDPGLRADVPVIDIETFKQRYDRGGRWFYTILTRPASELRSKVSLLRDRVRQRDDELVPVRRPLGETLEIEIYQLDPYRLADGTGLHTPETDHRASFRLDVTVSDGATRIDGELTKMREEIDARASRGFEVRMVRCFSYKLDALWFTDPSDPSHRADHYLPIPPVPYYLEAGREYSTAELRDALIKISPVALAGIEHSRTWIERLDRETAYQGDDG
jgi:Papain-like cysteine protease AvrRpt2